IRGEALGELARKYLVAEAVIERLARILDVDALRAIRVGCAIDLTNEQTAMASAARLSQAMAKYAPPTNGDAPSVRPRFDDKHEKWLLVIERKHHGNVKVSAIDADFLVSADYLALTDCAQTVAGLIGAGAEIRRGEGDKQKSQPVSDFRSAMRWLLAEAERGVGRQRYKGLGEINAEQLWEATMDPAARRLLRVPLWGALGCGPGM